MTDMNEERNTIEHISVQRAFDLAVAILEAEQQLTQQQPGKPAFKQSAEPRVDALPGLGGKPVVEHRELFHEFADGTVWRRCPASECSWGRVTAKGYIKTHSDKTRGGTLYSAEVLDHVDEPEAESSEDDPCELTVPTFASRDDEPSEENLAIENAVDEATEDEEGEDE